jgi:hypothetical protein
VVATACLLGVSSRRAEKLAESSGVTRYVARPESGTTVRLRQGRRGDTMDDSAGLLVRALRMLGTRVAGFPEFIDLRDGARALRDQFRGGERARDQQERYYPSV